MAVLKFFNPNSEQWETISAQGGNNIVTPIFHRVIIENETKLVPIGVTEYNPAKDILLVFQNSVFKSKDIDYEIQNASIFKTNGNWLKDDILDFVILKSVADDPDLLYVSKITYVYTVEQDNISNIPFDIVYTDGKDALSVYYDGIKLLKDENFVLNANKTSIDLLGWSLNTGDKITFEVLKKVSNTDNLIHGNQLEDNSIEKVKLSIELQNKIDEINIIKEEFHDLAGPDRTTETVKQNADDIAKHHADYLSGADSPLAYNLLPDSGRFVPTGTPLTLTTTAPFAPIRFFTPINGSTPWVSSGKFIHNNTDFGGSAGNMTQTVIDLIDKMSYLGMRSSPDFKRYGVEFYVAQSTMGAGTATPFMGKYLLCNNGGMVLGHSKVSFGLWIRGLNGDVQTYNTRLNMDGDIAHHLIKQQDGWTFIVGSEVVSNGYNGGMPRIWANEGTIVEIALPAVVPGGIGLGWITSPMPSIASPIYTADGTFTATLQNGWTGSLQYSKNYLGQVAIKINVTSGTITEMTTIATLPTGYRPSSNIVIPILKNSTGEQVGSITIVATTGIARITKGTILEASTLYSAHSLYSTI